MSRVPTKDEVRAALTDLVLWTGEGAADERAGQIQEYIWHLEAEVKRLQDESDQSFESGADAAISAVIALDEKEATDD